MNRTLKTCLSLLALGLTIGCNSNDDPDEILDADLQIADADPDENDEVPGFTQVDCDAVTADVDVAIGSGTFVPLDVTIAPGDVIQWTNTDNTAHTVTSGDPEDADRGELFDSGDLAPTQTFCLQIDESDTYTYHCRIHPVTHRDATVTVD